jgi:hypothetical protein
VNACRQGFESGESPLEFPMLPTDRILRSSKPRRGHIFAAHPLAVVRTPDMVKQGAPLNARPGRNLRLATDHRSPYSTGAALGTAFTQIFKKFTASLLTVSISLEKKTPGHRAEGGMCP